MPKTRTALTEAEVAALDPTHYRDGCEQCVAKPIHRERYVATPISIVPDVTGGIVATYHHWCGYRWHCSWMVD